MEVYVLDENLRRVEVVDQFKSLIWTDRYAAYGDFELVLESNPANRGLLPIGTRIIQNESDRVMTVETIENKRDDSGQKTLTLKGRSFEQLLEDRVATDSMAGTETNPEWVITGTPAVIARKIFNDICRFGTLSVADIIPYQDSTITTLPYTRPEPTETITVNLEHTTVYTAIKDICDAYGMGFRLRRVKRFSPTKVVVLQFHVYTGNDRTTGQSVNTPVLFSQELDNLQNTTEFSSIEGFKNVAYVFAKNGSAVVYAPGTDPSMTGFQRRVMFIKADDITDAAGPALTEKLNQKGYEELAKTRGIFAFDGEIPKYGQYKYKVDYDLGDLVEMRNSDGATSSVRVSEQIFVSDEEGDRSYPTLSVELTAGSGTWAADDTPETWAEATDTWATT